MTWNVDTSCGFESGKIAAIAVPYLQGRALDLGCGNAKCWPTMIGMDNGHHWGRGDADIVGDCTDLSMFADASMDAVFSSHLLEHVEVEDVPATLAEWWRVLRVGGRLVLYLPHKDLYPNMGEPGANTDHKSDFVPDDIIDSMRNVGSWTILENEVRSGTNEYSFFQVYRKDA